MPGAGRSGRAPSSVEVSRITAHLSCREKSVSSLAQGRGLLEECPGLGDRKCFKSPCERQEVGGAGQVGESWGHLAQGVWELQV